MIVGLVNVLLVNVCVSANVIKLSPCNALLNSAIEPVNVFEPKSIVLFVSVSVVALPMSVSVAFGTVIVLSAVGSTNAQVVSYASSVAPSKTSGLAPDKTVPVISIVPVNEPLNVPPLIVGLVNVLFVSVSELSNVAKLALCKALLNSVIVPVKLLPVPPKSNDLFVSVSVVALPINVSVALGNESVLSAVGSTNAKVVSYASSLAPSNTNGLAPARTTPFIVIVPVNAPLIVPPFIVGLVSVLLLSVCVSVSKTTSPPAFGKV